jgi:DNA-binding NarL/FixJ family response regulator
MSAFAGSPRVELLVVARYPATRAGLRALLDGAIGVHVAAEVPLDALVERLLPPFDVILADVSDDPDAHVEEIEAALPGVAAVLIADWATPPPSRARGGPARGYLGRDATSEEIEAAVAAVAHGLTVVEPGLAATLWRAAPLAADPATDATLTEREHEVLRLIARGLPNKGIALELGISEHTAKFHVGAILSKLGAASRTEAVMAAARRGILPL